MSVTLLGDSNAAMWGPAFQQLAQQRHWQGTTLTKAGCPMLDLPIVESLLGREYTECQQWRSEILERLRAERPQLIVLSISRQYGDDSGYPSYGPAWVDSMHRLMRELRSIGSKVLVLGPIPDLGTDVPVCVSAHLDDAMACSSPGTSAVNAPGIAAETTRVDAGGGQYADLTPLFCTDSRCPAIVGHTLVYLDESHLTLEYSGLLAPAIGALADRELADMAAR